MTDRAGPVDRVGHNAGHGAQHGAPGVRRDRGGDTAGDVGGASAIAGESVRGCTIAGALLGHTVLQHRPLEMRMVLVALAEGFLITTMGQGIIPEANREGKPGFACLLYIRRPLLYTLMSLALKERQ